jgi:hypothetical protein
MSRTIGLFAVALAAVLMLNAGPAKAQSMAPQVAPGGADAVSNKPLPRVAPLVATGNAQTAVSCSLCFTCGGDWPVFAGTQSWSSASNPACERGSGCGNFTTSLCASPGFSTQMNDKNPFLCCR